MAENLKFLKGTRSGFDQLGQEHKIVESYFYLVTEETDGKISLYLGSKLIAKEGSVDELDASITNVIKGLKLDEVKTAGKAIVSVSQTNGQVSATVGNVSSEYVGFEDVTEGYLSGETTVSAALKKLSADLKALGTGDGSVQSQIKAAIEALDKLDTAVNGQYVSQVSEENGVITVERRTLVDPNDKILSFNADQGAKASFKLESVTGTELTQLGLNVREAYKLVDKDGNIFNESAVVKVYKDQTLLAAQLGHVGATWDAEKQQIVDGSEQNEDALLLAYTVSNGTVTVVAIPLGDFLRQNEFKNGLAVSEAGEVSVLADPASDSFLSVSEAGVKVSGVQAAIDKADKLDQEIKVTGVNVGNLTNGKTLEKGQSIEAILREMLMKKIDAKAQLPTVSISNTGTAAGTYEVGTKITPTLAHSYTDGKFVGATSDYNLNQAAGCEEGTTTYYRGETSLNSNTETYTLKEETVSYTCKTTYEADTVEVKDNLGGASTAKIDAGTATSGKISFTGKRYGYYGGQTTTGFEANSANIRALGNGSYNKFTKITLPAGKKQVVIAFPAAWGSITQVKDDNGMNAVITTAYKLQGSEFQVEGANKFTAANYKVYIMTSDTTLGAISHTITIG